jgi:hypothetical protein
VKHRIATPFMAGSGQTTGLSALSANRRTLYLFVSDLLTDGLHERLLEVDVGSGEVLAERDLTDDVGEVSLFPVRSDAVLLVARPGGGVTLAFDASPSENGEGPIPTLLTYDEGLVPLGQPVSVTGLEEAADTQAATASSDGTIFLLVRVPAATWVLAVPDGGGAGPVLVQMPERVHNFALFVEPAQIWALLPAFEGTRALDLTTGNVPEPLKLGCGAEVRRIFPATNGSGALVLGTCNGPRVRRPMLWFVGP